MITLIENGDVYAPRPLGRVSVLLDGDKILKIGRVDRRALDQLDLEYEVIDASGCIVTPGLIDPHEHLLGGSGEEGFSSQTPWVFLDEIVRGGITTVVGVLGVDTTMKTLAGLLGRVKGLAEQGISAFLWTGGYNVPPTTMLSSVREDILFITEVLGAGEVAIADERATDPQPHELARLVNDAHVGGMLSGKAGLTHFHVGPGPCRLSSLRTVLDNFRVEPSWLYPTHLNRNEALLNEGIDLIHGGTAGDFDTTDGQLAKWLRLYLDGGGDPSRLTLSTDASISSPQSLHEQIRACVAEHGFPLEVILPLATANTANILHMPNRGRLEKDGDADVLVLEKGSLAVREVLARGRRLLREGELTAPDRGLQKSERTIRIARS